MARALSASTRSDASLASIGHLAHQHDKLCYMGQHYTNDLESLRTWVGRSRRQIELVSPSWCNRLGATLDHNTELSIGDPLPPLWHFITHPPCTKTSDLDEDGHLKRGDFLPPVALPSRMWAGSRFQFHGDIRVGDDVDKRSTIGDVKMKSGRSGALCFVTVKHELSVSGVVRIVEEQDLVFLEATAPSSPTPTLQPAPANAEFSRIIEPSEVMLFRYSALTFNSHRIHYDRDYVRDVEGYRALVVHGPLIATLLADLVVTETREQLASFAFTAKAPLFDDARFTIAGKRNGENIDVWAQTTEGDLAMSATATVR